MTETATVVAATKIAWNKGSKDQREVINVAAVRRAA
jgi:hypothetical protein